jgi:hypothetical protein
MADQADPIDQGRETLLRALREGDVRFVVIGGAALQSHGQRYETARAQWLSGGLHTADR